MSKEIVITNLLIGKIKRFVSVRNPNDCWNWIGGKAGFGYGYITVKIDGRVEGFYAHRVAYVLAYGIFDWDLYILHSCDNPACCNPQHLFLGTQVDNMQDCAIKGRSSRGERNGKCRITEEDVQKIKLKAALDIPRDTIAKEFNISKRHIYDIVNNRRWRHI